MKKITTALLALLLLAGCATISPAPTPTQTVQSGAKTSNKIIDELDYTYLWYGYGLSSSIRQVYVQTGYYGFCFNPNTASFMYMGGVDKLEKSKALQANNDSIKALAKLEPIQYSLTSGGNTVQVSKTEYVHKEGIPMSSSDPGWVSGANPLRLINSGPYLQRADVMRMVYGDDTSGFSGRCEFSAMAGYLHFTYDAQTTKTAGNATLSLLFPLPEGYTFTVVEKGKSLLAKNAQGGGFAFALPKGSKATLEPAEGGVKITGDAQLDRTNWKGFTFAIIPRVQLTEQALTEYYAAQNVTITARHTEPIAPEDAPVAYHPVSGAYKIEMANLDKLNKSYREKQNMYERLPFTVKNDSDTDVTVLLCFYKPTEFPRTSYSLWGMSPMLLDAQTKEPVGIAFQQSRNPHNYIDTILYHSCWVEEYVYVKVPARSSVGYEFATAYSMWGGTYAASMAQMCLVGWGGNQWWISSSLGSFGITFDFDPELTCGRAVIDDIGLIDIKASSASGGSDFLVMKSMGYMQPVINQKLDFLSPGPNLAQLDLYGNTKNKAVSTKMSMILSRCRDYTKMLYSFEYTFLEDVTPSRLAFFTLGADNYNGYAYQSLAYGSEQGLVDSVSLQGNESTNMYKQQNIMVPGDQIWVAQLVFAERNMCDKAMAVRSFEATINGVTYTKPSLNIFVSYNGEKAMTCELGMPEGTEKTIKAGSIIKGTVEVFILPINMKLYNGNSEYIKNLPANIVGTWEAVQKYTVEGNVTAQVTKGTLIGTWPTRIKSAENQAAFTLTGGIGYVPVTVTGLNGYSGYRLYKVENGKEVQVDQSTPGQQNDYWQAYYDVATGTYELTFNVDQAGGKATEYRLHKAG